MTMKNECAECRGKFGLVIYRYRGLRFCRLACAQTYAHKHEQRFVFSWWSFLRLF
jgi:hypothetical protein